MESGCGGALHGLEAGRVAKDGFMHLINSGAAALDATGVCKDKDGRAADEEVWDVTQKDIAAMLKATKFSPANRGYFRGGGFSSTFSTESEMPVTLVRSEHGGRSGVYAADR